jgi:hypothetical protein
MRINGVYVTFSFFHNAIGRKKKGNFIIENILRVRKQRTYINKEKQRLTRKRENEEK